MVNSICDALLQLLALAPFVFIASRTNGNLRTGILVMAALVFMATSVTTDLLSNISFFKGQQWNWAGKLASFLVGLIFIFTSRQYSPGQFGLTTRVQWKGTTAILLICAGYFLFRISLYLVYTNNPGEFHTETILFQATLPGIAEEVVFRGILLTLLNGIFVKPRWTFANVSFGWAVILTSILFGLIHGLSFDSDFHLRFNAFSLFRTAFEGFLFALLTEKTKSVVPGILFHNLLNLVGNH